MSQNNSEENGIEFEKIWRVDQRVLLEGEIVLSTSTSSRAIAEGRINSGIIHCPFCTRKLCSSPKKDRKGTEAPETYAYCRSCYQEFVISPIRSTLFHSYDATLQQDTPDFGDYFEFNGDPPPLDPEWQERLRGMGLSTLTEVLQNLDQSTRDQLKSEPEWSSFIDGLSTEQRAAFNEAGFDPEVVSLNVTKMKDDEASSGKVAAASTSTSISPKGETNEDMQ